MEPLQELIETLVSFRDERNWKQFQTLKNLAIAISVEAAELLEHFQWRREEGILSFEEKREVTKEVADVFLYILLG